MRCGALGFRTPAVFGLVFVSKCRTRRASPGSAVLETVSQSIPGASVFVKHSFEAQTGFLGLCCGNEGQTAGEEGGPSGVLTAKGPITEYWHGWDLTYSTYA